MPESAKVLQFRQPAKERTRSSAEAVALAEVYLESDAIEQTEETHSIALGDPDVVLAILARLRSNSDSTPGLVATRASDVYRRLSAKSSFGLFDERDYFLGESALIAGSALRLLGRRDEAELWLDRAEAGFRHVVNPGPALANIAYARLSLHYDAARYERALELLPSLTESYRKLGLERESLKCRFLEAMCLKNSSRIVEARGHLQAMADEPALSQDSGLSGLVLLNLGDLSAQAGETGEALANYKRALPLLQASKQAFALAHLRGLIAEALRADGNLVAAARAYREAIQGYVDLEMATWVAYLRVVLAETLIALSRNREAEWEIRMALPTIEEQKMVPEGFAALTLLRESVERRNSDPVALRELREHLQTIR